MKALIASPYYGGVGGLQQYTYRIAVGLHNAGVDTTVVTCSRVLDEAGPRVFTLRRQATVSNTPFSLRWFGSIRRVIDDVDPDIVNGHLPVPYMADVAARVTNDRPFVLTYHNDAVGIDATTKLLVMAYYRFLGRETIRRARWIITTSQHYAARSPFLKGFLSKTSTVPPGVDVTTYNPTVDPGHIRQKYGIDGHVILFVGQLNKAHRHKGLPILIRALQHLDPSVTLVVVGDGNWRPRYANHARRIGVQDRVVFAGLVPEEEMPLYYRAADLAVLPTLTDAEGFGMVLAEANACGRPVIGTTVGGIPSAIQDGYNGFLVRPGDLDGLVEAIRAVLADEELADQMGRNGYMKVKSEFTWTQAIARTIEVYDGLI
jgi:glycosyltransferase involved in cell wall biosynthesis